MPTCYFALVGKIWILSTIIAGITATITEGPSNAVAEVGQEVTINCTATAPIDYWYFSKKGVETDEVVITGPGCSIPVVNGSLPGHFSVVMLGGGTSCTLIITDITTDQGGVYRCLEGQNSSSSILTVIDSIPIVDANYTTNVGEKDRVVFTCMYSYNGALSPAPTLQPYIYWTDFNGLNVTDSGGYRTDYFLTSQILVTAGREDILPYTAHVYFQLIPAFTDGYADNIPNVNISNSSSVIEVLYRPGNVSVMSTVSTTDKCVYKLENLTCSADANPPANYSWVDLSNYDTIDDVVISISSGGQYQCTASNTIRGQQYFDTITVTETDCHSVSIDKLVLSGSNCTDFNCSCIGNKPATITCDAYGVPAPTYEWRYDNEVTVIGNSQTIEVLHDGIYACNAFNSFGGPGLYIAFASVNVSNCVTETFDVAAITNAKLIGGINILHCNVSWPFQRTENTTDHEMSWNEPQHLLRYF